ncbi:MAG: PmoA family protein [Candidatus Hydrogenedentes bacterium]|nr:PmoA family protein [Candidatus Hydrogenedentota bacterium]
MSYRVLLLMFTAVALTVPVAADTLDGKSILLEAGDQTSVDVPVSIPFDGTIGEGEVIRLIQSKTAKEFLGTLRNGELTFVPEGARPGTEHLFAVKVQKDNVPPRVRVTKRENENAIDVLIDDVAFTTYWYPKEARKPYLWPVLSDGDVPVTRAFPMGEKEQTDDHPHHRSFWSSYGNVNGADCWGETDNAGWQETNEVTYGSGDGYGWIHAKNTWADKDHKPVCLEEREYRFYPGKKDARLLDVQVKFTPIDQDVKFIDTKEGGIVAFRMRDSMTLKNGGEITNADGITGGATWGKPSAWCDYTGPVEGKGAHGITVFDNPANLRYPTTWHVRDYGLMGANCFGYSDFTKKEKNGDYTIKQGELLTFNYRIYVHRGDAKAAKVADRYADYINAPKVSWSDAKLKAVEKKTVELRGHEKAQK